MGVNGLWTVLSPVARPIALETLAHKRLAVDSSVWLYQFQLAIRDKKTGDALQGAHILGFLRRISKLLYHGIKPVFVFDGDAPTLKRKTLAERKKRKSGAGQNLAKTAERLLAAQMRAAALDQAAKGSKQKSKRKAAAVATAALQAAQEDTGDIIEAGANYMPDIHPEQYRAEALGQAYEAFAAQPGKRQHSPSMEDDDDKEPSPAPSPKKKKYVPRDEYALPKVDGPLESRAKLSDPRFATEEELREVIEDMRPEDFDIDSEFFGHLPVELKYEIIGDLRIKSRQVNHRRVEQMRSAPTPLDFSKAQIQNLMQRNDLTQKLLTVTDTIGNANISIPVRVASERNKQYLLVKQDVSQGGGWVLGVRDPIGTSKENPVVIHDNTTDESVGTATDSDEFDEVDVDEFSGSPRKLTSSPVDTRRPATNGNGRLGLAKGRPPSQWPSSFSHFEERHHGNEDNVVDLEEDEEDGVDGEAEEEYALQAALLESAGFGHEYEPAVEWGGTVGSSRALGESTSGSMNSRPPFQPPAPPAHQSDDELSYADSDEFDEVPIVAPAATSKGKGKEPSPAREPPRPPAQIAIMDDSSDDDDEFEPVAIVPPPNAATGSPAVIPRDFAAPLPPSVSSNTPRESEAIASSPPSEPFRALAQKAWPKELTAPLGGEPVVDPPASEPPLAPSPAKTAMTNGHAVPLEQQHTTPSAPTDAEGSTGPKSKSTMASHTPPSPSANANTSASANQALESHQWSASTGAPPAPLLQEVSGDAAAQPELPAAVLKAVKESAVEALENDAAGIAAAQLGNNAVSPRKKAVVFDAPESDEEVMSDWEPTPSPEPEASTSRRADAEEDMMEDDDEEAVDFEREQEQFVGMMSQLQNRDYVAMRQEVQGEIERLQAQRNQESRGGDSVTRQMATEIKEMLALFGLPYVDAPSEAEAECANLMTRGLVDGIITDDSDVFLFGAERVYRHMFNDEKYVECYNIDDISRELGLDRERLVRLAHFLGSDYIDGLFGVGPVLGMEIMAEFPSADGLKKFADWWRRVQSGRDTPQDSATAFKRRFKKSKEKLYIEDSWPPRAVYNAYMAPVVSEDDTPFSWTGLDLDGLRTYLNQYLSWGVTKTDAQMLPLIQRMNDWKSGGVKYQTSLSKYFDMSGGTGTFKRQQKVGFHSKRMQDVISAWRQTQKNVMPLATHDSDTEENVAPIQPAYNAPARSRKSPAKKRTAAAAVEDGNDEAPAPAKKKRAPAKKKKSSVVLALERGKGRKALTAAQRRQKALLRPQSDEEYEAEEP